MKNLFFLVLLLSCAFMPVFAQKHDHSWVMSSGDNLNLLPPPFNEDFDALASILHFTDDTMTRLVQNLDHWGQYFSSYSNAQGELQLYSPGGVIFQANGSIVEGGEDFGITQAYKEQCCPFFYNPTIDLPNLSFFVPLIEDSIIWYFQTYYAVVDTFYNSSVQTAYAVLTKSDAGYSVTKKGVLLPITDFGDNMTNNLVGKPIACKHANGRDWWILVPEAEEGKAFHKILIQEDTFKYLGETYLPSNLADPFRFAGTNVFTQNGGQLVIHSPSKGIFVYDFNRCNGELVYTGFGSEEVISGISIYDTIGQTAPYTLATMILDDSDRFAYISLHHAVVRYDLQSNDLFASKDTVFMKTDTTPDVGIERGYGFPILAPDGKIYFIGDFWKSHILHNPMEPNPNLLKLEEWVIDYEPFETLLSGTQNFPHYRLGPIDGSPCDTLGINNDPLAAWNYTKYDTIQHIVQFWDLTDYEPTYWYWDFGDGDTSTMQNPQHQYDKGGAYWVCLIVGNANSADTLCKWVYLPLGTPSNDVNVDWPVSVYPNPTTSHQVTVVLPAAALGDNTFVLYDMQGRLVLSTGLTNGRNAVDLGQLSQAHYAYAIRDAMGHVRASGMLEVGR
jgi:PKD domain